MGREPVSELKYKVITASATAVTVIISAATTGKGLIYFCGLLVRSNMTAEMTISVYDATAADGSYEVGFVKRGTGDLTGGIIPLKPVRCSNGGTTDKVGHLVYYHSASSTTSILYWADEDWT